MPAGVYVPLWFDHREFNSATGRTEQLGHVVVYKDGVIWSSLYKSGQKYAVLGSIADVERIYSSTFVGWSEDLAGTKLIQVEGGEEMEATSYEVARIYAQKILFRDMSREEWEKFHQGKSRNQLFDEFSASPEWEGKWQILNVKYPEALSQLDAANKKLESGGNPAVKATVLDAGIYQVK